MVAAQRFDVSPGWSIIIKELKLRTADVLRRARLPEDLLNAPQARITTDEYFRLFSAIVDASSDPLLSLKVAQTVDIAHFDPVVYAGFCSPNLNHAAVRMAQFKRLMAPVVLSVDINEKRTSLTFASIDPQVAIPAAYEAGELVWWTAFVRAATHEHVCPTRVVLPERQDDAYVEYFGAEISIGRKPSITFAVQDATLPFLAANEQIWSALRPSFDRRLADLDSHASTSERIRLALMEMLPAGQSGLDDVGKRLGVGPRTLQRKLTSEGTSFQHVLSRTRKDLAMHYLEHSRVSCAEISFLLGFEDPNSFFRAFHSWTGSTAEATRMALQHAAASTFGATHGLDPQRARGSDRAGHGGR